jgi:hypothetical protein
MHLERRAGIGGWELDEQRWSNSAYRTWAPGCPCSLSPGRGGTAPGTPLGVRQPPRGLKLQLPARDGCDFLGSETVAQLHSCTAAQAVSSAWVPSGSSQWGRGGAGPGKAGPWLREARGPRALRSGLAAAGAVPTSIQMALNALIKKV